VKKIIAALAAVAAAAVIAGGALAITYGQLDGERHPEVGALVNTSASVPFVDCSGTLISPTVFLTAAHCDLGSSTVSVTFDSQFTSQSKLYTGTYHADPLFGGGQGDAHDIAVVVFSKPIGGLTPAHLPAAGVLDRMKAVGTLSNATKFTAVGYGAQERSFVDKGTWFLAYEQAREHSVSSYNSLNKGYMRLSQNPSHGDGGTCYGDSGGPDFFGAGADETTTLAAITITGDTPCTSTNVTYRLDTPSARAFLGQFVTLP
jgi:Trypsin